MRPKNARLVVPVAAIAVAAVVIGGALAYRQGPSTAGAGLAAPLSAGPTDSEPGTPTPRPTPSAEPSRTPSGPAHEGPKKIALELAELPKGRVPQIPYLVGREVLGGAGHPVTIPGKQDIQEFARLGGEVLAVLTKGSGTELIRIYTGRTERVADVSSVVTNDDETAAAYAGNRTGDGGGALRGGTVYALTGEDKEQKLSLPDAYELRVLAYVNGKVYFRSSDSNGATKWRLFSWEPGESEATEIKTVDTPTALTRDGRIAASRNVSADFGTCSSVTEVATGKRLWRTCDYQVLGFTPDGTIAVGGPAYGDGYAPLQATALDAKTGNLLREWSGGSFLETVVEDDQHFLIIADEGPDTPRGVIRCSVPTGACEQALPRTTKPVKLGK